ncbi:MAG: hypothetical protein OXN17_18805 [Candidatus Poribacteria bacterium]|nr:hypothetical protein [Candidatus Poribacteria bacterium]MDE0506054.1 hypothetical protein [Candidatus Poribacteria bacterium]
MKFTHIPILIALSILITLPSLAQQALEDVVYLKDGTVIRGIIIKQIPGGSITIRTKDGSQFVYSMHDVSVITKEPVAGSSSYTAQKNPPLALGLSCLLPGLGQFYNEQPEKGVVMFGGSIVGLVMMIAGTEDNIETFAGNLDVDDDDGTAILGFIVWGASLGWSMIDAYSAASRINEQKQSRVALNLHPAAGPNAIGARFTLRF